MNQEIYQKIEQLKQEIANLAPQRELAWRAFKALENGEYARLKEVWHALWDKCDKLKHTVAALEEINQ